jgi:hypothetical protein
LVAADIRVGPQSLDDARHRSRTRVLRFALRVDTADLDHEVARLVSLGASDVGLTALGHRLRDPDGIDLDARASRHTR